MECNTYKRPNEQMNTDCKSHWLMVLQNSTRSIFKFIYNKDPVTSFELVKGMFKMPARWNAYSLNDGKMLIEDSSFTCTVRSSLPCD